MDENKIFDLLEKIYIEVQETKTKVNNIEKVVQSHTEQLKNIDLKIEEQLI
jgi:regulator of replication initiation timing